MSIKYKQKIGEYVECYYKVFNIFDDKPPKLNNINNFPNSFDTKHNLKLFFFRLE